MVFALVSAATGIVGLDGSGKAKRETDELSTWRLTRLGDERWAVATGRVLRRTGDVWEQVADVDTDFTCVLPVNGAALGGTTDGALLRIADGEAERVTGFDTVDGRDSWHAVPSGVPYVRSMSATAAGVIFANVHVGGIPRSTDGGATWEPTIDPEVDVHEVRAHPTDPSIVVAAAGYGYAESTDGGETWEIVNDGLHATYTRSVAFTGDAVLVTASTGPFNTESAVYRREVGKGSFEQCGGGLPNRFDGNIDTGCLDADGEAAVLLDSHGAVWASRDDGHTWSHLAEVSNARSIVLA